MSRPTLDLTPIFFKSFHHFTTEKWKKEFHHFTTKKWKRAFRHFATTKWKTAFHYFTTENEKQHVPDDPDPDSSLSESLSKKKKRDKKKCRCKHRKDDSSDPSSIDDSNLSDGIDYKRKLRKKESDREKYPIKLCACLTEKFLMTAYKSKIVRFKMDKDTLKRRIYFLTFL